MASPGEDYHSIKYKEYLVRCAADHERLNRIMKNLDQTGTFNALMNNIRADANNWTLTVEQHGLLRKLFMAYFGEGSSII